MDLSGSDSTAVAAPSPVRAGGARLRRLRRAGWAGVVLTAALVAAPVAPTGASAPARARPEVERGSARFGSCPASAVRWVVTVANPVLGRGQAERVTAVIHDVGPAPCSFSGPPPGSHETATLGPCGVAGLAVERTDGREVWPGPVAYSCPAEFGSALAPGGRLVASGQWGQEVGPDSGLPARLPAGHYVVVVAGRLKAPITVR